MHKAVMTMMLKVLLINFFLKRESNCFFLEFIESKFMDDEYSSNNSTNDISNVLAMTNFANQFAVPNNNNNNNNSNHNNNNNNNVTVNGNGNNNRSIEGKFGCLFGHLKYFFFFLNSYFKQNR